MSIPQLRTSSGRFANRLPEPDVESILQNAHPDSRLWQAVAERTQSKLRKALGAAYIAWADTAYPEDMQTITWREIAEIATKALFRVEARRLSSSSISVAQTGAQERI